jgi:hypothetical protein
MEELYMKHLFNQYDDEIPLEEVDKEIDANMENLKKQHPNSIPSP